MGKKRAFAFAAVAITTVVSCRDGSSPTPTAAAVEARFGGTSMVDTPWPSDVLLVRHDVRDIPLDGQAAPIASLAATLSELDGAPSYTSVFFPVAPGSALANGPVQGGRALYIDLDSSTPAAPPLITGLYFRADTNDLVALAPQGEVLAQGHRYACIVDSDAVRPSPEMRDFIDHSGIAAAVAALQAPPPPQHIGAASVFTVGNPAVATEKMRDVAYALPLPKVTITRMFSRGAEIDDLLGTPSTTRPGLGDPAGIVHDAIDRVILGTFEAPSFLHAEPPKLGRVENDPATGAPRVKGTATIPFMLTLPNAPSSSSSPLLIFQHGLNASRAQVATVANDYARAGYATIGIDALGHGGRATHVKDERHEFTGAPGADGLADAETFGAAITVFDLDGDASQNIGPFDGRIVRDNFRQAVVDLAVLVRLVKSPEFAALIQSTSAAAAAAVHNLDTSKLVYTGESFGSILGMGALAITPDLNAAVLSVGGGGIFLSTLPRSPLFTGIVTPLLRMTFDSTLDTSGDATAAPPDAQRSLALLQAAIMPGDPLTFAPLIQARNKSLLMLMARSDELIPNESGELLASAARATFVTLKAQSTLPRFATFSMADAPAEPTIALVQLTPALHTMFTSFTGERRFNTNMPPIESLSTPEQVTNPIELVHGLAIHYADTFRGGKARVY